MTKTTRTTQIALAPDPFGIVIRYAAASAIVHCALCTATSPSDDLADASRRRFFTEDYNGAGTFAVDVLILVVVSVGLRRVPGQMQVHPYECPLLFPATGPDTRPHTSGYHRAVSRL